MNIQDHNDIKVLGRVVSIAVDGIVADTELVYDSELKKTQQEINKTVAEQLNGIDQVDTKVDNLTESIYSVIAQLDGKVASTQSAIETLSRNKLDKLTFDELPNGNSINPVTSRGINNALSLATEVILYEIDKIKSDVDILKAGQEKIVFDTTPTANSANAVTSGGVKSAIDDLVARIVLMRDDIIDQIPMVYSIDDMRVATTSLKGLMSAQDKTNLDRLVNGTHFEYDDDSKLTYLNISHDFQLQSADNIGLTSTGEDIDINAGDDVSITANDQVLITSNGTGDYNSIKLQAKDGNVVINAQTYVEVNGYEGVDIKSGTINIVSDEDLTLSSRDIDVFGGFNVKMPRNPKSRTINLDTYTTEGIYILPFDASYVYTYDGEEYGAPNGLLFVEPEGGKSSVINQYIIHGGYIYYRSFEQGNTSYSMFAYKSLIS